MSDLVTSEEGWVKKKENKKGTKEKRKERSKKEESSVRMTSSIS